MSTAIAFLMWLFAMAGMTDDSCTTTVDDNDIEMAGHCGADPIESTDPKPKRDAELSSLVDISNGF